MGLKNKLEAIVVKGDIGTSVNEIVAISFLYETLPHKSVLAGSKADAYYVKGENRKTRFMRFMLCKIIPGYQPHILPRALRVSKKTRIVGRKLKTGERLDNAYIHSLHAKLLSKVMRKESLEWKLGQSACSAIAIRGDSVATGEARIALVVRTLHSI